jgi:hypothetical protein
MILDQINFCELMALMLCLFTIPKVAMDLSSRIRQMFWTMSGNLKSMLSIVAVAYAVLITLNLSHSHSHLICHMAMYTFSQ